MRVMCIGGTGHIGSFLVPLLVEAGHQVIVVSRGKTPACSDLACRSVQFKNISYTGDQGWRDFITQTIAEVIIDILGGDVPGTFEASRDSCKHYIACGSFWMFGPARIVPTPEQMQGPCEFKGYAQRYSELLLTRDTAEREGRALTAIMPPNICGPGKIPLECHGGRSLEVHIAHKTGPQVYLPKGCNTLIGPCDAEDIAMAFLLAVSNRQEAAGEIFNVASAYALSAPEFVETYGTIYDVEIPIEYVSYKEFYSKTIPDLGAHFHFREHMLPDISKIRVKLGYEPRYTPEETMARAVNWMREKNMI